MVTLPRANEEAADDDDDDRKKFIEPAVIVYHVCVFY